MPAFVKVEDEHTVAKVLRCLWEYRESLPAYATAQNHALFGKKLHDLINRLETCGPARADHRD